MVLLIMVLQTMELQITERLIMELLVTAQLILLQIVLMEQQETLLSLGITLRTLLQIRVQVGIIPMILTTTTKQH